MLNGSVMSFIALRSYDNYIPAHLMLQQLEEEGIKAYLQDEHSVTINPMFANAIGGIKLMVHTVQAERALEIIETIEQNLQ